MSVFSKKEGIKKKIKFNLIKKSVTLKLKNL